METIGQKIQRLRLAVGLTQEQLAESAEVPLPTLRQWEQDRREPGMRAAVKLAIALRTTVTDLADTVPVSEAGRTERKAGPTLPRRVATPKKRGNK